MGQLNRLGFGLLSGVAAGMAAGLGARIAMRLVYCGLAVFIFWRGSAAWMARFAAVALLIFAAGFFNTGPVFGGLMGRSALAGLFRTLGLGALLVLLYIFPDGRFEPRWTIPMQLPGLPGC